MEPVQENELFAKVKAITQSPHGDLLRKFVDFLYKQVEEYDEEPLTTEELAAIRAAEAAIERGEYYTLEELKKDFDL